MQRFVTYIYAYDKNKKNQNIGFAKVDVSGEQCQIEIHLKKTGYTNVKSPVYLFTRQEERLVGVEVGQISFVNGMGDLVTRFSCNDIMGSSYGINDMNGLMIILNNEIMFASQWDEQSIEREKFVTYDNKQTENSDNSDKTITDTDENKDIDNEKIKNPKEVEEQIPQVETMHTQSGENTFLQAWQKLVSMYTIYNPFQATESQCIKIELKDIRELPKRYWYLGNNSFLLHGYFNYRYLLLGQIEIASEKKYFLGVPGYFQNQERVMAAIFGFPEFLIEKKSDHKTNEYGYWYRLIEG